MGTRARQGHLLGGLESLIQRPRNQLLIKIICNDCEVWAVGGVWGEMRHTLGHTKPKLDHAEP